MKHIIFTEAEQYQVAVLIKGSSFYKTSLESHYVSKLPNTTSVIALDLRYDTPKPSNKAMTEYCKELLPVLDDLKVTYLYIADTNYFKHLTKVAKVDGSLGYVLPCKVQGYTHFQCVLGVNYNQLIYNPEVQHKLDLSISTLNDALGDTYKPIGTDVIHSASYPDKDIASYLELLHKYPALTMDLETFSLRFHEAGIGSVGFAWDLHNGIAFEVDDLQTKQANQGKRYLVRKFLETYHGKLIFHNAAYDLKVLIYTLWMRHPLDQVGLLKGLETLCPKFECTKLITYLATNTTAGNKLGLKELAHSFAGNYAQSEIKDITRIPKAELLKYNLVDCLSTWFVYGKYYPKMVEDSQLQVYLERFKPAAKTLLQTELTGMPMSDKKIAEAKQTLVNKVSETLGLILSHPRVKESETLIQQGLMEKANAKLKTKQHTIERFADEKFNPNSGNQLQVLLYEVLGLPVLEVTATKQPATGGDVLTSLQNHCQEADKPLLKALVQYSEANKILTTFIPAFEAGFLKSDGVRYLHGSFNLGYVVSGRLSSSDPNLTNLPSKSEYGDAVKAAFVAPEGWVFAGADFASLEDMVSALTTKDKNKVKVYTDGYCGHCLRAAYYYRDELPHIDLNDPKSVNLLKKTHPEHRQNSKAPTFLLTYGGTYHGLVSKCGMTHENAKAIEANYHTMYAESDQYIQAKLKQASIDGYVTTAFGLRVRTPLLKQVVWDTDSVPREAEAEARTAGNALGQGYCALTNRATDALMERVWASKYRYDILPVCQIHDATYFIARNNPETVTWLNNNLIECMKWQELPELEHPVVKLGAELDLFIEGWHKPVTLKNNMSEEEVAKALTI